MAVGRESRLTEPASGRRRQDECTVCACYRSTTINQASGKGSAGTPIPTKSRGGGPPCPPIKIQQRPVRFLHRRKFLSPVRKQTRVTHLIGIMPSGFAAYPVTQITPKSDRLTRVQVPVTAHAARSDWATAKNIILGTSFAPIIIHRAGQGT